MSRIALFGLGRLGLPWALLADRAGHSVVGVDSNPQRVAAVNERKSPTSEPGVADLLEAPTCSLSATTSAAEALEGAEISVIAVPTQSTATGAFSDSVVLDVVEVILSSLDEAARRDHLLIVASTLSPGAMKGAVIPLLQTDGAAGGPAFAYLPEFHAVGSIVKDLTHPRLAIIGVDDEAAVSRVSDLVASITAEDAASPRVMGLTEAEVAKLALNGMMTLRIAYANFLGEVCDAFPGVDAEVVCSAIQDDPRVGRGFLSPGPPFGGPCFPRDVPALQETARQSGASEHLMSAVEMTNQAGYERIIDRVANVAGPDDPVGIVGVAFKPGVDDIAGSVGLELAARLMAGGRSITLFDPAVVMEPPAGTKWELDASALVQNVNALVLMDRSGSAREQALKAVSSAADKPAIIDAWT